MLNPGVLNMHREKDLTLLAKVWPPPPAPPPCPSNLATYKCEPYCQAPNLAHRGAIFTSWSINYSGQRVMTNPSSFISFSPSHSEWQHLELSGQRYIYSVMIHKVVFLVKLLCVLFCSSFLKCDVSALQFLSCFWTFGLQSIIQKGVRGSGTA